MDVQLTLWEVDTPDSPAEPTEPEPEPVPDEETTAGL